MFNLKFTKTMKDIQWSFISLVTASFSHLLLRIVLGKELGPTGLGLYTLVFTIYMFGMQFAAFGIGAALTKYIAQYNDEPMKIRELVTSGVAGSIVSGFVMGVLLYLLSGIIAIQFFNSPDMTDLLKISALCFPFLAMQKAVIGTLNGLRRMKWFAVVNIVQNVSVLGITVILVLWLNMDITGAVFGFVLPTIVVGLFSLAFVKDYFTTSPKLVHTIFKEISCFGFYVVLANSIGLINTNIDNLLIGYFMNETEVGYYSVAIIFMMGITILPQSVQRIVTPSIATYYGKRDFGNIRKLIKSTAIKTFTIIVFISAFLALFGKFMIVSIFTDEFVPAHTPMLVLLIGYSIFAVFIPIGGCLASIGKVQILYWIGAMSAILNILLNITLIPQFGIVGAAGATSISLIFIRITNLYFIIKHTRKNQTQ